MTDTAAAPERLETEAPAPAASATPWLDRVASSIPIALAFVWLCILYAWESKGHKTPWDFTDELQTAQLSRAIWHTGHAARRGMPHGFQSLYSYLIAPAWWIEDVHRAYATVKYIGVITMSAVVFPTYWLARLVVGKPAALFAAVGAGAAPALMYSTMLLPEPLAYTYAVLCFFLVTKALITRRWPWFAAAVAASAVAPWVRGELALIPFAFVLAIVFVAWGGERARRWRSSWTTGDWVGFVALCFGALILFNLFLGRHSTSFSVATGHYKHRMFVYGIWAAGALTIGIGVLPVIAGLAALFRRHGERRTPELRAFTAVAWALIIAFGAYAAIKASYLSTVFATRVEERNLIYLVPVLMVGTAIWLERPRLRPVGLAFGGLFVLYMLLHTPYQLDTRLSIDAPGLSILALGNRDLAFDNDATRWLLIVTFVIAIGLLAAPQLFRLRRAAVLAAGGLAAGLVVAWTLTGQIAASNSSNVISNSFLAGQPRPTDWAERVTKGAPTLYLGQNITDPNGLWGLEFWNPSIHYVWSLDGSAPGPGPVETPNIDDTDGHLQQQRGELKYVIADSGIDVVGKTVAKGIYLAAGQPTPWNLIQIEYPVRLRHATSGIFSDGWMSSDSTYSQFSTKRGKPGYAVIVVSRRAWGGTDKPGNVTIRVGKLGIKDAKPYMAEETARRTWTVHSHGCMQFVIPSPAPPVRMETHIEPTFVPYDLDPSTGDRRQLGATVSYAFSDRKPAKDECAG